MRPFCSGPLLALLLAGALLAGCGQKGPLYLPKPQPQPPSSEQASQPNPSKPQSPPSSEPASGPGS